ncbi:hypothetical protein RJ639_031562 [Escallonia herrerae]|uniref:FAF domain-containing protein n=1 Tax=Escallonia herrerae TaxID=1293975 RepID=A0AA88X135_9ASTE|nr:hypothetical protein RJ639_031562 [Escallonia herrerae]
MASSSFSSLKDLLKNPKPPKSKLHDSSTSSQTRENPSVTEMFGELYFKGSPSPLPTSDLFPTMPLNSSRRTTNPAFNAKYEKKEKLTFQRLPKLVSADDCMYANCEERLFPQPISCLKQRKNGKPFVYLKRDKDLGRFVLEEINICREGIMCASRRNGRLKMNVSDDVAEEEVSNEAVEMALESEEEQ